MDDELLGFGEVKKHSNQLFPEQIDNRNSRRLIEDDKDVSLIMADDDQGLSSRLHAELFDNDSKFKEF